MPSDKEVPQAAVHPKRAGTRPTGLAELALPALQAADDRLIVVGPLQP